MKKGIAVPLTMASLMLAGSAAAQSRPRITPHIQASQVLSADLQSGDVLTYTTLGAGVDVSANTRRVQVQLSYNYEHRFSYDDRIGDSDVHSGLARANVEVANGLSVGGSAIATRTRSDIRGADPILLAGDPDNITQVYSFDVGPSYEGKFGPLNVGAAYRFGYTKVEAPGPIGLRAGEVPLDNYDSSTRNSVEASIGASAGSLLPVGITLSGGYDEEHAKQLDQRFEDYHVGVALVAPVSRTVAIVGSAGYEKIRITQRDPVFNADGDPVVDANGRFVTDRNSPRRTAYETDTPVYWDAGVLWRPSSRTELEARVGRRYDSWTYTGSFSHQIGPGSGIQVGVYDSVQSFGRQLGSAVRALPTQFETAPDTFNNNYNGCVFGSVGSAAGGCLNGVFQSVATSNYHARGVDAVISFNRGGTRFGGGIGYANHRFYAPRFGPGMRIDGSSDESYYAQLFADRALDSRSDISGNIYVDYFDSGLSGSDGVFGAGANGTYSRSFGRLGATVSAGLFTYKTDGAEEDITAQALLGLGYSF